MESSVTRRTLTYLGTITLLGAVYFLAAKIGIMMIEIRGGPSMVWVPSGISLAAVVRLGYRVWPGIVLGGLLTNLELGLPAQVGVPLLLGEISQPLIGAFLLRRFCCSPDFLDRVRDAFLFVGFVTPVSTLAHALVGATLIVLGGVAAPGGYLQTLLTWWLGDLLGFLVVAPLLLAWTGRMDVPLNAKRIVEGVILVGILILVCGIACGGWFPRQITTYQSPLAFLLLPFVLWAAYRFGLRGATMATAMAALTAAFGTLGGYGPFVRETLQESVFLQQSFVGLVAAAAMVLAAANSERQGSENALRQAHDELDDRVRERTADLMMANEWLKKAFEERERSVEQLRESERLASIGTLATGIAHEINNPLGGIVLSAEYALAAKDAPDGSDVVTSALGDIVQQAKRGGQIVKSVLQFARREPTERWPNDLNQIIRAALDVTRSSIEKVGVFMELELDEALPQVRINPFEMQQVLVNVIQNAVEAGDARTRITIRSEGTREGVRVMVEDNGPGLSEPERRRVFDPFYTTRQREGGTGLGLSIAHGIVAQHGGEISLVSEPGWGTQVIVQLPLELEVPDH
jgi:signal transduction histidine kinase